MLRRTFESRCCKTDTTKDKPPNKLKCDTNPEEIVWWILGHPLLYSETLIKMGYEPISPNRRVFFGKTFLTLPNSLSYVMYIASKDGITGCFTGLIPRLYMIVLENLIQDNIESRYPWKTEIMDEKEVQRFFKELRLKLKAKKAPTLKELMKATAWKIFSVSMSTIVTQPFYIVMVRMMASFVGRETNYNSASATFKSIFRECGLKGFFKGLIPRLIYENLKIIIPVSVFYIVSKTIGPWNGLITLFTTASKLGTIAYAHQFDVVSATMVIENSSLVLGQAPFITKKYTDWMDCWSNLYKLNIQYRGVSPLFRYYSGPTISINGEIKPSGVYIGPYLSNQVMLPNVTPVREDNLFFL